MRDNNQKASPPQAKPPEQPQPTEAETAKEPPTPQATVGKSKFRIEEFDERFEEIEQSAYAFTFSLSGVKVGSTPQTLLQVRRSQNFVFSIFSQLEF